MGDGPGAWPLSYGGMGVVIFQVGRTEAVPAALFFDLPKEHLGLAFPGQLGELINGSDQERGQQAIDLLVNDHHGQSLTRRFGFTEGALSIGVAAVDERASPALANTLNFDVFASLDERAAPWATGQLAGAAHAAKNATAHTGVLPGGLFALLGGVWSRALPYPQAKTERRLAPGAGGVLATQQPSVTH